jgi:hypothetical protein
MHLPLVPDRRLLPARRPEAPRAAARSFAAGPPPPAGVRELALCSPGLPATARAAAARLPSARPGDRP